MTLEESEKLVCPYIGTSCINKRCMMWVETISGKKEIDRYKMPYDIYPSDEGRKHRELLANGYVETDRKIYIKYRTECYEGYCSLKEEKK